MEILTKVIITLVVVFGCWKALHWTWTSQIDLKATLQKYVTKKPDIADGIVTRDPNKIYQSGNAVGDVTGSVEIENGTVPLQFYATFSQILNDVGIDSAAIGVQLHDHAHRYSALRCRFQGIDDAAVGQQVYFEADGLLSAAERIENGSFAGSGLDEEAERGSLPRRHARLLGAGQLAAGHHQPEQESQAQAQLLPSAGHAKSFPQPEVGRCRRARWPS